MIDAILLNICVLVTGLFAVSVTFTTVVRPERWVFLAVRYALLVVTAFEVMAHRLTFTPDLMFDLRTVPIALASRRNGVLAGLLVALPLAVYRWQLGGEGAPYAVLNMLLVAALASRTWFTRTPIVEGLTGWQSWITPLRVFALANLTFFWAFVHGVKPFGGVLSVYLSGVLLSALGMLVGGLVIRTRLLALQHASRLEDLAFRDALTGVHNRRQFDEDLLRAGPSTFLLMVDLDHFKRVNDTHGHAQGDRVLAATAGVIGDSVRPTDRVYRLGGEEFAVLLHRCKPAWAPVVAERVRSNVARRVARAAHLTGDKVTISIGLVALGSDPVEALQVADERLYLAKAQGRNQVRGEDQAEFWPPAPVPE